MLVMDKVVALIAIAVAKKASAYAVVRVSEELYCNICSVHVLYELYLFISYLLVKINVQCCRFFYIFYFVLSRL
jgi:hypothetical protein